MPPPSTHRIDAAIVGGGIAGAWLFRVLRAHGYRVVLLESDTLGGDQTLASQGMIHGGLKYALGGALTGASEAIAAMPLRWRACLAGEDDVDLRGLPLLSDDYYLFAADSLRGRLTTFFASRALRGRVDKLTPAQRPAVFDDFEGAVYRLNDFVIDTPALLRRLVQGGEDHVLKLTADATTLSKQSDGYRILLQDAELHADQLISCAGNGSAPLMQALEVPVCEVQQRPLQQVIVRPRHQQALYGHCLTGVTGNEPRLTITSHPTEQGVMWYLGGQLATQGVTRSAEAQIEHARQELKACVPWLDWDGAAIETLWINRAEPKQRQGRKPDEAYAARQGRFVQCFPTKLTLAPDLGDRVLKLLDPPVPAGPTELDSRHPRAVIGQPPW